MKLGDKMLKVVDKVTLKDTKTKLFIKALDSLGMEGALVVMGNIDNTAALASRNLKDSKVLDVKGLNVNDMLKHKGLVLDLDAIAWIEEALS
jgi:ribosomal protein L4